MVAVLAAAVFLILWLLGPTELALVWEPAPALHQGDVAPLATRSRERRLRSRTRRCRKRNPSESGDGIHPTRGARGKSALSLILSRELARG
jgi:hypothetical protein